MSPEQSVPQLKFDKGLVLFDVFLWSINFNVSGVVSNIPSTMLCDQYGIVGLLTFMKGLDQFPGLSMLSIGVDITKLGLNMGASG